MPNYVWMSNGKKKEENIGKFDICYRSTEMSLAHQQNHETNGVTVSCSLQVTDTISADWIRTMLRSGVVYSCSMRGLQRGTLLCLLSQGAQQHVSQCAAEVTVVVRNW